MSYAAIVTKYHGPTNFHSARIKATCQAGSLTMAWDHALNIESNHNRAALALARKLGWTGKWYSGGMPASTGNCYVRSQSGGDYAFTLHAVEVGQ